MYSLKTLNIAYQLLVTLKESLNFLFNQANHVQDSSYMDSNNKHPIRTVMPVTNHVAS